MKKNTILYILIVFLAIANVFFLVNYLGHSKGKKGGNPGDFIAKELKFDEEQMSKFNLLNDRHESEMRTISKEIKQLKRALFSKISEEQLPKIKVDSITKLIGISESKRDAKTYNHFRAIQSLCTEDQIQRFNDIVKRALHKTGGRKPNRRK